MSWQVQEAKQRFSEVLRAVRTDGPQFITKHGEEVAVVIDINEYRRLVHPPRDAKEVLLSAPRLDDEAIAVLEEVSRELREMDDRREIDFGSDE